MVILSNKNVPFHHIIEYIYHLPYDGLQRKKRMSHNNDLPNSMNYSNPKPIIFSRQFNPRIFGCVRHTHNAREKSKAVGAHDSFLIHAFKTLCF